MTQLQDNVKLKNSLLCKIHREIVDNYFYGVLDAKSVATARKLYLISHFLSALISPENPLNINQFTDQRVKF